MITVALQPAIAIETMHIIDFLKFIGQLLKHLEPQTEAGQRDECKVLE